MFSRRFDPPNTQSFSSKNASFSKGHKSSKSSSSFSKESGVSKRRHEPTRRRPTTSSAAAAALEESPKLTSAIVTLVVGQENRLFAAHEDVLCASPYFRNTLQGMTMQVENKRIHLPEDEPEIFSSVLEYLYKGDYYPRLIHSKRRNSWEIEPVPDNAEGGVESTIYVHGVDGDLLKDTVIYCTAEKYGLDELKRVALRKQGLQSGIQCSTILASARYAYASTPDTDSKLRAHYLALIIRSRSTFKRSGTMQLEMFNGQTQLFFDLFVALCNHVDDVSNAGSTPRSNRHRDFS